VTVADHRPAYVERRDFGGAERVLHVDPRNLRAALDIDEFDAILVMSHHLVTDRAYLAQLVDVPAGYLGVLGPRARRERLLADLGSNAKRIAERLRGPVGLDIGGHSPEAIALSIVAELQMTLAAG
jgi:xanthine dehydrogenase accessory factor